MKKNGFTLIELVLSLSLIVVVILPVFGVVVGYKNKEIIASNKADLNAFQNTVLKTIQDDIVTKGISYTCQVLEKVGDNALVIDTKQRLMFRDGSYADIFINHEQKSITYKKTEGSNTSTNTFVIPSEDATLEGIDFIKDNEPLYSYFYVYRPGILKKDTANVLDNDNKSTVLKILIPITYEGIDYSIAITSAFSYEATTNSTCGKAIQGGELTVYNPRAMS